MHICVGKLTIIGSDNGLSPGRRQAIIWTNAGILLNEPLGTNFSEILIGIQIFSFKKMHLKMLSAKGRLFSLGLNVLNPSEAHRPDPVCPDSPCSPWNWRLQWRHLHGSRWTLTKGPANTKTSYWETGQIWSQNTRPGATFHWRSTAIALLADADIGKFTGPRSSTGENSGGPMKTLSVPVLLSGNKKLL